MLREALQPIRPVRWRHSLVARVVMLSTVLLLCLLGSVYVITRHYYGEAIREMQAQAEEMADSVRILLEDNPDRPLEDVARDVSRSFGTVDEVSVEPFASSVEVNPVTFEQDEHGRLVKVARLSIRADDRTLLLTTRVTASPRVEIMRAFRNKYLATLTLVFLVALGSLIYLIAHSLRPLRELSESCARISEGNLQDLTIRNNYGEILALEQTFNQMVRSLREKETVEANLRQAQRLSSLGTLAAGVAHDIRNPLNAIKLLAGHAVDTLRQKDPADPSVRQVETIRKEVDRLEDIVSSFLSLAREHELRPEPSKIDRLLEECLALLHKDAEERGIRLSAELRAGDATLMVDPKQWNRAMLNVLINALDACPAGGRVRVFSRTSDAGCEVEIRDDGPGMAPDVAERAFDPYFTTKRTGTGLGLSITRGIIEEHGGTISLTGTEGQGCQVLITMPMEGNTI
jgi:signal transduction histidine kinase